MTLFEHRERAIEAKFARDTEIDFRARIRAFRFLAVWASTLKGETVAQARDFARAVIHEDLRHVGDEDAVRVVRKYLGKLSDEATIRRKMQEFIHESRDLLELENTF